MMAKAGFNKVFVGIETPDENCLKECNKKQNNNRSLIDCVHEIQDAGIEVAAGFIVGFDNDPPNIFERQIDFIQKSGILTAMVGLLNAPRKSKLYQRLSREGRILNNFSGDNTDYSINFVPAMDREKLLDGYRKIIREIYSAKSYYERMVCFLKKYNPHIRDRISLLKLGAFLKSIFYLGILKRHRIYYWRILFWSIFMRPELFSMAVTYSIYGYHFRRVFRDLDVRKV